ncbi:MAG TPA: PASTA domain-containing protein [Gemmatimonadales bacterium]|nr:PASTA domain-containing protein [Gemmatimonadales bacterium]
MGLIVLTFVVGYAISVLWLSPGSVFTKEHALPRVLELTEPEARRALTELGFRPRLDGERHSDAFPRGTIIWQDPPAGTILPPNSVVEMVVSAGPSLVAVPDIVGMSLPQASKIMSAAGVRVGSVDTVPGGQEADVVLATRPSAGVGRPRGAAVAVVVSRGPEPLQ